MKTELCFLNGPLEGRTIELPANRRTFLGRASKCEIALKAVGISRVHCRFEFDGENCQLVDMGGVNGTFVNGERVPRHVLQEDDRIRVGQVEMVFRRATKAGAEDATASATVPVSDLGSVRRNVCDQCAAPLDPGSGGGDGQAAAGEQFCERCRAAGPIAGRAIGSRWEVAHKIALGGMGAVYKGHDLQADRPVAVKILSSTLSAEQESIRRFLRGAQMAKRLVHPHIVELYDVGESEGIYYIAMEFVDGPTALDAMAAGRLDEIRKVLRIAIQVTQGLVHAHERQVVHRDIKPSNIMITRSDVTKLTDMGLAKSLEEAGVSRITESGVGMGTVDYVSPEQLDDARRVDHRGDIYSLGATLFHLLTGEVVFPSRNVVEKMKRIRDEAPRIPTELNGNVPRSLSGVVVRMLAKKPEDRYQTPKELLGDLLNVRKEMLEKA